MVEFALVAPTAPFAEAAVESVLREGLLESVKSLADLHGFKLPATSKEQCAARFPIDSLIVVEMLCQVEPIVGFHLKDSTVKAGGYNSIDEAIAHVVPRIKIAWVKQKSGSRK